MQCKPDRYGAMCLRRTAKVTPAVQIKQDDVCGIWRLYPFPRNPVHVRGSDAHGGWDFVRERPKNCAGDSIVAATFQAAFDAPLGKPNRKMGLKAGHAWLRLYRHGARDERIADIATKREFGEENSGEGLGLLAGMGLRP